jgi:YidC/Oxa1 family membrane protein insertase
MQQKNFLLFIVSSFLLLIVWMGIRQQLRPKPGPDDNKEAQVEPTPPLIKPTPAQAEALQKVLGPLALKAAHIDLHTPSKPVDLQPPPVVANAADMVELGSDYNKSNFHVGAQFSPRGASVYRVVLNKFQQTENDDRGGPAWKKKADGKFELDDKGRRIPVPFELVPPGANTENPSYLLFLYDPAHKNDLRPLDTLGSLVWKTEKHEDEEVKVGSETRVRQSVTFTAHLKNLDLTVKKTYSLVEGDYHIGLEVEIEQPKNAPEREIRYQLTGAHGLPIEGKWYTHIFRNALIGEEENGQLVRDLQDLRQIDQWVGGNKIPETRLPNRIIRYAGVAVQFFASVIVVDNKQTEGQSEDFLDYARPTLERTVTRGIVKRINPGQDSFVLITSDPRPNERDQTFYVRKDLPLDEISSFPPNQDMREGERIAVLSSTDSKLRKIALKVGGEFSIQPLWEDDITVRVNTRPHKLTSKAPSLTHKYLLYNGPVKPSLLRYQQDKAAVAPAVYNRYVDTLHLNSFTDSPSPGVVGAFASKIFWCDLVINCTNLMHWVLNALHNLIPNYGVCIILLTVLVRGMMFPLSRKQAMMGLKMQALAPELKKMQAKFKDDKQGMVQAQMELYRKHKINPFGTCWLLLLQMPVFMGLYFAFGESINFRLASFWPTWIINLAAPDMLLDWGTGIPWISQPESYGSFIYLGPCLNLLPIIAVALMMAQQKMMTPPPTDEQQEMQQKVMKYMMVFFGLMFYKVAAGLCVYFIASSLWGFAERRLLPKIKPGGGIPDADAASKDISSPAPKAVIDGPTASNNVTDGKNRKVKPGRNKKKERSARQETAGNKGGAKDGDGTEESPSTLGRFRDWIRKRRQRLRDWWAEMLKKAEKK